MKLMVVGLGQCGGRIADEFARLGIRARARRKINILTGVFAVNTDAADLSGLATIKKDYNSRILIGGRKTGGHGVGKVNELAAEVAREDADKVIDALKSAKRFYDTDAFLLTAGAAGGTGSGSIGIISKFMKERYPDKPVYNLLVLPFEHEETTEERTVYNVATCLKTSSSVADAVFLVDNQRYVRKDASIKNNLARINYMISEPFYNLLCAGEEKKGQFIGAKLLDAGDIIQTLTGWTVIGYGKSETPFFRFPRFGTDFHRKSTEVHRGVRAMDEAITELSLKCRLDDARRALYLFSGPTRELNMDLAKELGDYMKGLAPRAVIRNGDYPRERGSLDVTVILSELSDTEKVRAYFRQASSLIPDFARRQVETGARLKQIDEVGKDIPSLI